MDDRGRNAAAAAAAIFLAAMLGVDAVETQMDMAPFTVSNASNVNQYSHHLTCSQYMIVLIWSMRSGYKASECQCEKDQSCCHSANDCIQDMSPEILRQVTMECWDTHECRPQVTKVKDSCQEDGVEFQWPAYSKAWYFCVPADTVVDMTKQTSVSGRNVTARALPAGLPYNHTVTCSVQTEGGEWVVVYAVISQGAPPLSCLDVGKETLCSQGRTVTAFLATTPFQLSLQQPAHSSLHYAWIRMRGPAEIHMTCGQGETTHPFTTAGTESPGTLRTDAVTSELVTSQISDDGASTFVPVSSSSGERDQLESGTESTGTLCTDSVTSELVTSQSSNERASSRGGQSQLESGKEDALYSGTVDTVMFAVAVLMAGLVGALAASLVIFIIRRRQRAGRAGHRTQPYQGWHIVLAELPTARPDVTYEPLRTEGCYARLAVPGRVSALSSDVISTGGSDYDDCDVGNMVDVTEENPSGDVIEPSHIYEIVD